MYKNYFKKSAITPLIILLGVVTLLGVQIAGAEPDISEYTAYPVNLSTSVAPNIMIILDNSGSMNEQAYNQPFTCGEIEIAVTKNQNDCEEELYSPYGNWSNSSDLDIGGLDTGKTTPTMVGVRFENVDIPQGVTITSAYISFKANTTTSGAADFTIVAENRDYTFEYPYGNWQDFGASNYLSGVPAGTQGASNRWPHTASVSWRTSDGSLAGTWSQYSRYNTPELKDIVQTVINRPGWIENSSLAFKIWRTDPVNGTGKRDAYSGDGSQSNAPVLHIKYDAACPKFYGYFDPTARYSYASNRFYRDPSGPWDGNFLNWLSMRKVDVARKVVMGGLATARTGGGNQTLFGEAPGAGNRTYTKWYDGTTVSPHSGNFKYVMDNGYIKVYTSGGSYVTSYTIAVEKDVANEPQDFYEGNLAGVMQRVGDKARWGNMWFYTGTGSKREGGFVSNAIGTNMTTLVTDLQNTPANTWTPLGETYYVCMQYFKQESVAPGWGFSTSATGPFNDVNDPYKRDGFDIECAKSFVLMITDGASTMDSKVPDPYRDYDGDGDRTGCDEYTSSSCDYDSKGTDFLDDVALYSHITDLRTDIGGFQNLTLYSIYAFGNDDNARKLLKEAARNGGFIDMDGDNRPDGEIGEPNPDNRLEWDADQDGDPDTYYEASDGYALEAQLMAAITDILKRASSGTAVSVLAPQRGEGEGVLIQAYFKPSVTTGVTETKWIGYLQGLWVDNLGQTREDTPPKGANPGLVLSHDKIVEFFFDEATGEAKFKRFEVDANGEKVVNFTDTNGNGQLDYEEPFIDVNGNGDWDDGDSFTDANGNGILDAAESYTDLNGNGQWDAGETFTDLNGNGQWDEAEPFTDLNFDGTCCAPAESFTDTDGDGVYDAPEPYTDKNGDCTWTDGEPYTDANGNGIYDDGETYTDVNGNGVYDDPEPYTDENVNGVWDDGEAFVDANGNCEWDPAEKFTDLDQNGAWTQDEPFVDANGNGVFDAAEPLADLNGNGVWDDGESYTDVNGNGVYDAPEPYSDLNGNGQWDDGEPWWYVYTSHVLDELEPIWEAGKLLQERNSSERKIKTFVDLDNDGVLDANEFIDFTESNYSAIRPFLGVRDSVAWSYLGSGHDDRTKNLIKFIRGDDSGYTGTPDLRNRIVGDKIWKLGDVVYSTPVIVGRPADNYNIIYGDSSYQDFFTQYQNREQVVFAGANDGMLHAYLVGKYNTGDNAGTLGDTEEAYYTKESGTTVQYGDELWSFIPQALLPHLKWLPDPDYTHVYYVDLKPRIADAKIFNSDATHPNGWGTVLIGGLNLGGKRIPVTDAFPEGEATRTFTSSYFAMDVTDPMNPVLLWEKTFPNIGLTTTSATVAKVGDDWFAIIGSGPTDYDGTSSQSPHIYVLNLKTGELLRDYDTGENAAFMGSGPVTVDIGLNFNVDVGYIGMNYKQGQTWRGKVYRFKVPKISGDFRDPLSTDVYDDNPANWTFSVLVEADGPVSAPPGVSIDQEDNLWVYFGTGRYFNDADKTDKSQQYFYGVKDPIYNRAMYSTEAAAVGKNPGSFNLLDSTLITVYTDGTVAGAGSSIETFTDLTDSMASKDGWELYLGQSLTTDGERVLNKPTILGGIVFDTTFIPNDDPCGYDGSSNILGTYFETGTAYVDEVFIGGSEERYVDGEKKTAVSRFAPVGVGRGSSVSIHVGKQVGATGYVQQSTGIVQALALNPAFQIRSGFIYWRER